MSFNDQLKAMFDMFGKTWNQIVPQRPNESQSQSTFVNRDNQASKSNVKKDSNHRKSDKRSHSRERLFAPRLMCQTPINNSKYLTMEEMAKNRIHCAAYYIYCPTHRRVAMTKPSMKQALWMPFIPIPPCHSWNESGLAGLLIILSSANMDTFIALKNCLPYSIMQLVEVIDIQLPQTLDQITRLQWYVQLDENALNKSHFKCCQSTDTLEWIDEKEFMNSTCIDDKSHHNETRAKFILRYYDAHNCGYLSVDDFRQLLTDMIAIETPNPTQAMVDQRLVQYVKESDFIDTNANVTELSKIKFNCHKMLIAIGTHKFRGTSKLCRLRGSILSALMNANLHRSMQNTRHQKCRQYVDVLDKPYAGTCIPCKDKRTILDQNLAILNTDGFVVSFDPHSQLKLNTLIDGVITSVKQSERFVRSLNKMAKKRSKQGLDSIKKRANINPEQSQNKLYSFMSNVYNNIAKQSTTTTTPTATSSEVMNESISTLICSSNESNKSTHGNSDGHVYNQIAYEMIRHIHEFAPNKGDIFQSNGLFTANESCRQAFTQQLEKLEKHFIMMMQKNSAHCVHVQSPAYVIGDIHGNLSDLLSLEACLWKRFPLVPANLVFLGDMVDRGRWSIECVTYLICLKILMPDKVTLLRGNHETRQLQCHYTYRNECLKKYGNEYGERVWQLTNRIFDLLPLCAVIDEKIFCAHGGIPKSALNLKEIDTILPKVIDTPEENAIVWEMLWSDPLHQQLFADLARFTNVDLKTCDGYLANKKRGTAWFFNEEAVDRFLRTNDLSHVIRAHEVPINGFCFHFDKKCATIFSCSHYCGNNNECSAMLIDRNTIRVIRIDTANNQPATD
ncbi:hypothetical protein RDWZM_001217 [Blomia tropicalis]|uniref:Serine/threonine-protein phosphatase n=1 Tax=Blomia tropicalis TaxID=40697 RepID=A0A9Q0MDV6_BLOTA|nr:hypothetical protein RDWZM_001217 [Blomia tropicalis]